MKTLRKRLMELCAKQGFDEAQVQAAVQRQTGKSTDDLTADELGSLVQAARQQAQPDAAGAGRLVSLAIGFAIERGSLLRAAAPLSIQDNQGGLK